MEKETAALIQYIDATPNTLTQFYHEWQITKTVGIKKPLVFRVRVTLFPNWLLSQCFLLKAQTE